MIFKCIQKEHQIILNSVSNHYQLINVSALVQEEKAIRSKMQNLLRRGGAGREGKGDRGKPRNYSDNLTTQFSEL
jgi:hypothetical protein